MHLELSLSSEGHTTQHDLWAVRTEDSVAIEVDGHTHDARVERLDDGRLRVTIDGTVLDVELTGQATARIAGHEVGFRIRGFQPGGAPGEHDTRVQGEGVVLPPMPGKLVTVEVAEGDEVSQGETLAVLEAMKMQSKIEAPRDGTVLKVHVQPGQAVEGKDVLFEIGDG